MTTYGEPRIWLDQFPLGEPQPFEIDYHGLRYPGEIIRSDAWDSGWGEPLTGDRYFRIVLLLRQPAADPSMRDSRIALCIPGSSEYRQRDRLLDEMATIRETQALYLTQRDPEADLIRRTLQRHQQGLEEELMAQEVSRYSSGAVLSGPDQRTLPSDLFSGTNPVAWFSRIAQWLLAQAYPDLPVDGQILPRVVAPEDPARLFRDIFHQSDAPPETLAELGPGLGLSSVDNPGVYNSLGCTVVDMLGRKFSEMPQPASWDELHNFLSHVIGLTRPLATLYLLVFLDQHQPELEVRLSDRHELLLTGANALPGARLTRDLLPALEWDDRLDDWATTIGPVTEPHWNDALPYLSTLCPGLSRVSQWESVGVQEAQLLQELARLSQELAQSQEFLTLVQQHAGDECETVERLLEAMHRLSGITGADFRSIYQSTRNVYGDYRLLEQDTKLLAQLSQLADVSNRIREAWQYLDAAIVPSTLGELSIEKQALAAALAPDSLLRFSRSWDNLVQQVADFKARFATAYREHHDQIQQSLPGYRRDLDNTRLKLRALELLNTIPELGRPAGEGLADSLAALEVTFTGCLLSASEIDLEEAPACPHCGLRLDQTLPIETLAGLLATIDNALGEKSRRLSNLLVEKILHGQVDQRLEDFLKIVQASDLSALSNTISAELVGFIRGMLA